MVVFIEAIESVMLQIAVYRLMKFSLLVECGLGDIMKAQERNLMLIHSVELCIQ